MPCALERLHGLGSGRGNHDSETVFALLPDDTEGCQGFLLRDMGYSVKEPVAGRFRLDEEKSLWLSTNYEMMDSGECFWFAGPNTRLRTSTVQGLSNTASLCMETRVLDDDQPMSGQQPSAKASSLLGW